MALKFLERLTLFASQLTDNARLDASNIDNLPAFLGVTTVDTLGELQAITGTSTSDIRYVDSVGRFKWDGAAWQPIDRPVTPEMFGAVGDGVTDDTSAFNAAMAAQLEVVGGAKTYAVTLLEPQTGTVLSFPGSGSAKLKSIAAAGISTIDDRPNTATNWTLRGVTVDGDVATRGAGAGNNIFVDNDGATFDDVVTINSPNAGLLADGVNEITYISIQANNNTGVGLSHSSVDRINGGDIRASDNGLENLTIDGDTDIVNINNLILGQHSGGCGNVGIDCTGDINI
uniref:hypothetical protein n=1 Tax=Zhongshania sp. TaxID=1971902 RepID=UPI0035656C3F